MAKIKLTKSELKAQRDSLKQFTRFLPTLQLKKQQLQLEARLCLDRIEKNKKREQAFQENIKTWIALFGDKNTVEHITALITVEGVDSKEQNIAGVEIPVYIGTKFNIKTYDLFCEEPWIDDAIKVLCDIIEIRAEREIIEEQYRRIKHELTVTTQRVNLFEKVKIPECKNNIRVIQIYLGDVQTAAVCRSKIAKRKMAEVTQ